MKYSSNSIKTIIDDWLDLSGVESESIDPNWMYKTAHDTLVKITPADQMIHKVALVDVDDYKAELPSGFRFLSSVSGRVHKTGDEDKQVLVEEVIEYIGKNECFEDVKIHVEGPCKDNSFEVEVDMDFLSRNPRLHYIGNKSGFLRSSASLYDRSPGIESYYEGFTFMEPLTDDYNSLERHTGKERLETPGYVLDDGFMRFNFREGQVLISYFAFNIDNEGYMRVPDHPDVIDALTWTIEARSLYRNYRRTSEAKHLNLYNNALQQSQKYISIARTKLRTPASDKWAAFLKNRWNQIAPLDKNWKANGNKNTRDYYRQNFPKI